MNQSKKWTVIVTKSYRHNTRHNVLQFTGEIQIRADSRGEAIDDVANRMQPKHRPVPLVHNDPRISWEEMCDEELLAREGYEYEEGSFRVLWSSDAYSELAYEGEED